MGSPPYSAWEDVSPGVCVNSNNFATSAASAEVYALLSASLVLQSVLNTVTK